MRKVVHLAGTAAVVGLLIVSGPERSFATPNTPGPSSSAKGPKKSYDLRRASVRRIAGTKVAGGCRIPIRLTLKPTAFVTEARTVTTDPETCSTVLEVGVPPIPVVETRGVAPESLGLKRGVNRGSLRALAPALIDCSLAPPDEPCIRWCYIYGAETSTDRIPCSVEYVIPDTESVVSVPWDFDTTPTEFVVLGGGGTDAVPGGDLDPGLETGDSVAAYRRRAAYAKAWVEDPPNKDVVWSTNATDWHYGRGCVHNPVSNPAPSYGQAWETGWERVYDNWRRGAACSHTWNSSYIHWKNPYFCKLAFSFAPTTHVYFDRVTMRGFPDGTGKATLDWVFKGGCTAALDARLRVYRTI